MSNLINRQKVIDTEGLDEQIRCEMCRNPMHTDRGCDGNCKYDEKLYERIIQILDKRIKPSPSAQQCMTATSNTMVSDTVKIPVMDGTTERLPSARPERKKGKWDFTGWQMFQCSECKHTFTQEFLEGWSEYTYESLFPPFCPNCGAKMER